MSFLTVNINNKITKENQKEIIDFLDNLKMSSQYNLHLTIMKDKIEFVCINKKEKYYQFLFEYCGEPKRLKEKTTWLFAFHKNNITDIIDFIKKEFEKITKEAK